MEQCDRAGPVHLGQQRQHVRVGGQDRPHRVEFYALPLREQLRVGDLGGAQAVDLGEDAVDLRRVGRACQFELHLPLSTNLGDPVCVLRSQLVEYLTELELERVEFGLGRLDDPGSVYAVGRLSVRGP